MTWKKVFKQLHQSYSPRQYRVLNTYSHDDIKFRLQNYHKAVFVRDPIIRLLSAYQSKFREPSCRNTTIMKEWEQLYGKIIARAYRTQGEDTVNGWFNITLVEFVRYVTEMAGNKLSQRSDHFIPMHILVNPCAVQYDFIGHFENIKIEGPFMLRFLGIQDQVTFPDFKSSHALENLNKEYQQVPIKLFKEIYKYYRTDYELFGYSFWDMLETIYFNH